MWTQLKVTLYVHCLSCAIWMYTCIEIFLERLIIAEENTRSSHPLMEPERSLPHSQKAVNELYREPVWFIPHISCTYFHHILILLLQFLLDRSLLPSWFWIEIFYAFPMPAIWSHVKKKTFRWKEIIVVIFRKV